MSLFGKSVANTYKDLLQIDNSNNGLNATKDVKDGEGTSSALKIGPSQALISPASNGATTFAVNDASSNSILKVNTNDSTVLVGSTQTYANTQIQRFAVYDLQPSADTHTSMMVDGMYSSVAPSITFGTDTDPATTYTLGSSEANAAGLTMATWYIPAAIYIDEVRVIASGEASDTLNFHLFSYDMATGTGSGAGDLSNGVVVASTGSTLTIGNDRVTTTTLTVDTEEVAADKVVIATVENVGASTDVTAQLIVKYHYQ
tara:strand:+ start:1403 stop:2179 length:777 start_codon:yes stop_codon:yes gene_type:complete